MDALRGSRPGRAPRVGIASQSASCHLGARVTRGREIGRNRPPLHAGPHGLWARVRFRVVQAVNLESHVEAMTCICEDLTCVCDTSEDPNPNPHQDTPGSVSGLLLLFLWIVHQLGSGVGSDLVLDDATGGDKRPGSHPPATVPASDGGSVKGDLSWKGLRIISRFVCKQPQLETDELRFREQDKGDNRTDDLRPNCFEISCKCIQNAPGVLASSRSIETL